MAACKTISSCFHRTYGKNPSFADSRLAQSVELPPLVNLQPYRSLRHLLAKKPTILCVCDDSGRRQEELLCTLGNGGCKRVFELSRGRALLLPKMEFDSLSDIAEYWEGVVQQEVATSQFLHSIGLLTPVAQQVQIITSEDSEESLSAYICPSFESLAMINEWFIIDVKNRHSSTWKERLFSTDEELLKPSNWDPIADSLLDDVAVICTYGGFPQSLDSMNVAVVRTHGKENGYKLRYFGFDFSSKWSRAGKKTCLPYLRNVKDLQNYNQEEIQKLLRSLLLPVLDYEFYHKRILSQYERNTLILPREETDKLLNLCDVLIDRYVPLILQRIYP